MPCLPAQVSRVLPGTLLPGTGVRRGRHGGLGAHRPGGHEAPLGLPGACCSHPAPGHRWGGPARQGWGPSMAGRVWRQPVLLVPRERPGPGPPLGGGLQRGGPILRAAVSGQGGCCACGPLDHPAGCSQGCWRGGQRGRGRAPQGTGMPGQGRGAQWVAVCFHPGHAPASPRVLFPGRWAAESRAMYAGLMGGGEPLGVDREGPRETRLVLRSYR